MENKSVAVVTGAGRGVGAAIAQRLAQDGFHICLLARKRAQLESVQARIQQNGGDASVHVCDVGSTNVFQKTAQGILDAFGRCDVLVNNAGVGVTNTPLHRLALEDWDMMLNINLRGPFLMLRAFAPSMIEARRGHIINIGSLAGKNPLPNGAAYAASKWGLLGLMLSAAEELRVHGVRVSIVSPGSIATGFGGNAPFGDTSGDASWKIAPQDIAEIVAQLVSQSDRSFISEVLVRPLHKPRR